MNRGYLSLNVRKSILMGMLFLAIYYLGKLVKKDTATTPGPAWTMMAGGRFVIRISFTAIVENSLLNQAHLPLHLLEKWPNKRILLMRTFSSSPARPFEPEHGVLCVDFQSERPAFSKNQNWFYLKKTSDQSLSRYQFDRPYVRNSSVST